MIDPRMMGMGQLPDVPTTQELWKKEKSQYRHWIMLFGIGIVSVLVLMVIAFVMNMIAANEIKDALKDVSKGYFSIPSNTSNVQEWVNSAANAFFQRDFIIIPSVKIGLLAVGVVYYFSTVWDSYKRKSFARISQWSTMIVGAGAFLAGYSLLQLAWASKSASIIFDSVSPGGIFDFVNNFLFIGVYFATSIQVSKIRRTFLISERMETIKNNPMFQQQVNNMGQNMGPFGNFNGASQNTAQPQQANNTPPKPEISKEKEALQAMTVEELKVVAKKLSISGIHEMNKKDLIKAILRVTGTK